MIERGHQIWNVNDAGKLRGRRWKRESSEGDARCMLPGIVIQLFYATQSQRSQLGIPHLHILHILFRETL